MAKNSINGFKRRLKCTMICPTPLGREGKKLSIGMLLLVGLVSGCTSLVLPDLIRPLLIESSLVSPEIVPSYGDGVSKVHQSYFALLVSEKDLISKTVSQDSLPDQVTSGSGFLVSEEGYVLTAAHIALKVGNRVEAQTGEGRTYQGEVVALSPNGDLALVKLKGLRKGMPVIPSAPCPTPGEVVVSLGRHGVDEDIARFGVVQFLKFGRPVEYRQFGYQDAMVFHLKTREGESGGPVFRASGELVGMIVSRMSFRGRPLELAHVLPLPVLARFVCGELACGERWTALAHQDIAACPSAERSFLETFAHRE